MNKIINNDLRFKKYYHQTFLRNQEEDGKCLYLSGEI